MSTLHPGSTAANAKQTREVSKALASLNDVSKLPFFNATLDTTKESRALATISSEDADELLAAVKAGLASPHPYVRNASLRVAVLLAKHGPPSIFASHWVSLTSQITSILKSASGVNPSFTAQALATLASLISAGASVVLDGGDHKASIITACHSALAHVTRLMEGDIPLGSVVLASTALLFAILYTAPREFRQVLPRLETALWGKWLGHPSEKARLVCAKLLARLLICFPEKVRQKVFDERVVSVCAKHDQILNILDYFTPGDRSQKPRTNAANLTELLQLVVKDSANDSCSGITERLSQIYSATSLILRELLSQGGSTPLFVPVPELLHSICRGFAERHIDLYTPEVEGIKLNADGALRLTARIERESLENAVALTEGIDPSALLPYVHVLAQTFQRRLAQMILKVQTASGCIASSAHRCVLFNTMARIITFLGCGFIEQILEPFSHLLENDIKVYARIEEAQRCFAAKKNTSAISESARFRKRRRVAHPNNRSTPTNDLPNEENLVSNTPATWSSETVNELHSVLMCGMRTATTILENRGLLNPSASSALHRIENAVEQMQKFNALSSDSLDVIRAIALGGGSNRLHAEASSFLSQCISLSKHTALSMVSSSDQRIHALRMRSSAELLVHPRGPPMIRREVTRRDANADDSHVARNLLERQENLDISTQKIVEPPQSDSRHTKLQANHKKSEYTTAPQELQNTNTDTVEGSEDKAAQLQKTDEADLRALEAKTVYQQSDDAISYDNAPSLTHMMKSQKNTKDSTDGHSLSLECAGTAADATVRETVRQRSPAALQSTPPPQNGGENILDALLPMNRDAHEVGGANSAEMQNGNKLAPASAPVNVQSAQGNDLNDDSPSEIDEDALVASLKFEPPDKE